MRTRPACTVTVVLITTLDRYLVLDMDVKKIQDGRHGSKMVAMVPKWLPVIDMGVISLSSEFQPYSSSNG